MAQVAFGRAVGGSSAQDDRHSRRAGVGGVGGRLRRSVEGRNAPVTTALTTTTVAATTTTSACPAIQSKALRLLASHASEMRGIVAPDEAAYTRRAKEIRDEAVAAGCPVPIVLSRFLK